jgi:hypothetical protein
MTRTCTAQRQAIVAAALLVLAGTPIAAAGDEPASPRGDPGVVLSWNAPVSAGPDGDLCGKSRHGYARVWRALLQEWLAGLLRPGPSRTA